MPTMIIIGKEMLRISPKDSRKLEYSTSQGRSWLLRFSGNSSMGAFIDLVDAGKELIATTENGLYYSTSQGCSWLLRKKN